MLYGLYSILFINVLKKGLGFLSKIYFYNRFVYLVLFKKILLRIFGRLFEGFGDWMDFSFFLYSRILINYVVGFYKMNWKVYFI